MKRPYLDLASRSGGQIPDVSTFDQARQADLLAAETRLREFSDKRYRK